MLRLHQRDDNSLIESLQFNVLLFQARRVPSTGQDLIVMLAHQVTRCRCQGVRVISFLFPWIQAWALLAWLA
jgi:hypothetical protein